MLTNEDVLRVKARGFLLNRGSETFNGRIVPVGAVFTTEQMAGVAELARLYGNGKLAATSRLCIEVFGIPYDKLDDAERFLTEKTGLSFGGVGARIRPVTCCKGTTCVFGTYDTQALAKAIHERFYMGMRDVTLPHKFKIGVGGCPNSCMKPSLNDFGIEGRRVPPLPGEKLSMRYQIYVGGTWGRNPHMGDKLPYLVDADAIMPLLEKSVLWFRANAYQKERFAKAIARVGLEKFLSDIETDDLLMRKDAILAGPILVKPQ